jgi:DNA-binding LacI/PurR family transcriptional regulator
MVGYVPSSAAQSLRGRQSHMIGVAVPLSSISPDFYLQILSGIKKEAEILGYRSMIFDVTTEEARVEYFAKMPFLGIVDGLIAIGLHIDERRLRILEQQRLPVVIVHNRLEQSPVVANVLPASERALRDLIDQHLIRQHGYRRLALVTLSSSNPLKMGKADRPDWTRVARIQAYKDALRANEMPFDEKLVFEVSEHSFAEGYRIFREIQRMNQSMDVDDQIEVVICTSDTLAAAVLTAVRRHELDMAVTGFDNLPLAELLDITTVEQRAGEVGRLAFRHLYNALVYERREGSFPAFEEEGVDMQVVIRCSCGCPHYPTKGRAVARKLSDHAI